jgi:EmrB/QacA subfamily drug resistance transporter
VSQLAVAAPPNLSAKSRAGRWVIVASVLGTSITFLDGTVVNAALPAIADDLDASLADLQWVMSGYLLTLGAFLVIGGSLGDLFGRRRMYLIGLFGFAAASLLCGIAPDVYLLIVARCIQGVAAAILMPESLAIISASFRREDRGRAIGLWSAFGGVGTALGPFLGGWLIDSVSWRLVFLINIPLIAVAVALTLMHVPESYDADADHRIDVVGGSILALALGGLVFALIEGPSRDWDGITMILAGLGALGLLLWLVVERRSSHPMVPLRIFRSRQFSGANLATFVVYVAIGATFFLLVVFLQTDLGYSALEAGAALLPITALLLVISSSVGALAQRIGPRIPMTVGPLVIAAGILLLQRTEVGSSFWSDVLPGVVVMGTGISINLAPLTTAVLAAIDDKHAGIGSAINNAVARLAGLLAIAVLPAAAGIASGGQQLALAGGFDRAMQICAALAAIGAVVAWLTIRTAVAVQPVTHGNVGVACQDPCLKEAS